MGKSGSKGSGKQDITKFYDIKEKIGSGSFATVKRVRRKQDGKEFAVKIIKKAKLSEEELDVVHDEVEIMHKIDHKNCAQLYEMFENSQKLFMVMELLSGGELFDRIVAKGSYSEKEAAIVTCSVVKALKYLHAQGIVHRDLKPENLIYASEADDSLLKITDFGLAKCRQDDSKLSTACGTPGYVAPEVLEGKQYGKEVDLWSLGVILYILLCGFPPFYDESTTGLYRQIKKGQYDFPDPYWTEISDDAKGVVKRLLTVDATKRATPDDLLKDKWVAGEAASDKDLGDQFNKRLKLTQARRTLRKGVRSVIAINRFARQLQIICGDGK